MSPVEPTGSEEERAIERVLEAGLARSPLTDDAYARIQAAVATEWRLEATSRPVRRRWLPIAAGLAAATLLGAVLLFAFGRPSTLGVVAQKGERAFVRVGDVVEAAASSCDM